MAEESPLSAEHLNEELSPKFMQFPGIASSPLSYIK